MQKAFLIGVLGLFTLPLWAETQTGYVRTIGRNGKPGQPISGVMVRAEGPANMVMSDSEGQFALLLNDLGRDDAFKLTTVKKSNYELLDKDLIGRECGFTPVPMEIVLVNLSEMQAEKAAMAERFEQKYAETYQKKVAELQAQLDAQQITIDEAQKRQEELDQALEKMLGQIETLVDRYVRTDYDRLDSLDQVINAHIEQGEFDEAERLIKSKGSVEERLAALKESKEVQRQLEEAQRKLAAANDKKQESLKRDLNLLIDIADAHLRPDSAYYFQKQLAEVEPENINVWLKLVHYAWQFDQNEQVFMYLDEIENIFYNTNHHNTTSDTLSLIDFYSDLSGLMDNEWDGLIRITNTDTLTGESYYNRNQKLVIAHYGEKSLKNAQTLFSRGRDLYDNKDKAEPYLQKAKQLLEELIHEDENNLWYQYTLCGVIDYLNNFDPHERISCYEQIYEKAILDTITYDSLIKEITYYKVTFSFPSEESVRFLFSYYPYHLKNGHDTIVLISCMAFLLEDIEPSNSYADSCCSYVMSLLDENRDDESAAFLSDFYKWKNDYENSIKCLERFLNHTKQVYGAQSYKTGDIYESLADVYKAAGDIDTAIDFNKKAIVTYENSPIIMSYYPEVLYYPYERMGYLYFEKGLYAESVNYYKKALEIAQEEEKDYNIAASEMDLGRTYQEMGDKKQAKEWYQKALKVYRENDAQGGIAEVKEALAGLKNK